MNEYDQNILYAYMKFSGNKNITVVKKSVCKMTAKFQS